VALVPYGIAFQDSAPYANGYRFMVNPGKENMSKVQRFRAWIVGEMEEMRLTPEAS
jgi:LysR family glycine cleavage system transcriptional activator